MSKTLKFGSIFLILTALIAGGPFVWMNLASAMQETVVSSEQKQAVVVRPIPTTRVQKVHNTKMREFPGTIRAAQRVDLAFTVMGKLEVLNAREGTILEKGDVIASMDKRDFKNAVVVAQAQLNEISKNLQRIQKLYKNNVASASELDQIQSQFDVAAANLNIKKKALEDTVIYAPFRGVVAKRYVENHEHVKDQAPVLSFQDISRVEIVIQIPEQLMFQGGTDNLRNFRVQYQGDNERWSDVEIHEHRVQADAVTQTFDIILTQEPPTDFNVLPGMNVTVAFESPTLTPKGNEAVGEVLIVPTEAVFSQGKGDSWVWLIADSDDSTPRKVKVKSGALREDGIEILEGLQADQLVATSGIRSLTENTHVRPMKLGREGLEG